MESPPTGGPTPPEAETAPDASGGLTTAAAMPKGPRQQPPEPEWIGDGEGTSPAGERGGGGDGRGDGGRRGAWVLRMCAGGRGRARTGQSQSPGRPTGGKPEHMAPREGLEDKSRDSVGRDCPSVSFELG